MDLNPDKGPYWQWSKLRPHPLQKTFPSAIVSLFEDNGFIWGKVGAFRPFRIPPRLIIKAKIAGTGEREKPERIVAQWRSGKRPGTVRA
ncbi:MAG: M15 family metallopeptidase [Bilophila wadsworthia]